jgi:hypothetical protein
MKTAHLVATALVAAAAIAIGPQLACGLTHDDYESLCRLLNNQAAERAEYAVQSYGFSCSTDSDCAIVDESTSCSITCPTVATTAAAASLPAALQAIESSTCAQYKSTVCVPAVTPPCVGTPAAVCRAGMCALATFDGGTPLTDAAAPEDAGDLDAADGSDAADAEEDAADAGEDAADASDAMADASDASDASDGDAGIDAD